LSILETQNSQLKTPEKLKTFLQLKTQNSKLKTPYQLSTINYSLTMQHKHAYLDIGCGKPLLMLHGFLGEKTCWLPLIELLQSQFRCISLDMLGFGESSKPEITYDVAVEVAFVRQVVEQLNIDPCCIIGHSFGGWVASAYALKYPNSVSGLILAAPAGIRDDSFCGQYDALRPLLWETPAVDWALQLAKPLASLAGKSSQLQQISEWRRELMSQPVARSFLMSRMRPEDAVDTVEKDIHKLQVPTLVITGDADETIPLWHSETYAREIPGAKLVIIPSATHALPQTQASAMANSIGQFLGN
jgi:pimeloyl-ACP methyl ester carboxylesterase